MAVYKYIRVALTEQGAGSLTTLFNYGATATEATATEWISGFPAPGYIFDLFLNARECYVQWTTQAGNYISLIFRNPFASHNGFYMITLMAEKGTGLTGRQTIRALAALRKKLVEEKRTTDTAVDEVLRSCSIPETPKSYDSWRIEPTFHFKADSPACYRTFVSTQELETYFTFLRQEEYDSFSRVIYVAATTSLRPGVELQHVIKPIRNLYTIDVPAGVEVSRKAASAGDRVMLTYHRDGFSPLRETVVVGRPSMYVTYDGAVMRVKSAAACRLTFVRRIPLEVRSAKGGPVAGYMVTVNGRQVSTMEPFVEITEQELRSPSGITIAISSTNYETCKIERRADELTPDTRLEAELMPVEQGLTLRLDFGEGRIFEITMKLEKNTPEYSQLHAGQFHGFRAHRLTVPGRGEIYNVDVRAAGRPVAPAFPKVEAQADEPEKAGEETGGVANEPAPLHEDHAGVEQGRRRSARRRSNMIGLISGVVLLMILIGAAVFHFFPAWTGLTSGSEEVPADTAIVMMAQPETTPVITESVLPDSIAEPIVSDDAALEQNVIPTVMDASDISYLNRSGVWVRDSIRSDIGRQLYDAIAAGDIEAMASNTYFAGRGACTNPDAEKVVDILWKSHGTATEKSNQRCMTSNAKSGQIDLRKLFEDAARYRSPEPNTRPRPNI